MCIVQPVRIQNVKIKNIIMKKLLKEELREEFLNESYVNLNNETEYYTDIQNSIEDDPDYAEDYKAAINEFGLDVENIAVINSYAVNVDWEDIKDELDKRQIEYYEFDLNDGESVILFDIRELSSEEEELT